MNNPLHIVIIGAGASGMITAIMALRNGARVTLLERQDRVGKKLLATGNGRCNLANTDCTARHYHGDSPILVDAVLRQFSVEKSVEFFESLGIITMVENGRIYPRTGQGSAVLDALRSEVTRLGADVKCEVQVNAITLKGNGFAVCWKGGEVHADRVIVAAGGMTAPSLGGTRDGIALLEKLGHHAKPVFPALVPVQTSSRWGAQLKGIRALAAVKVIVDGKECAADTGEVQFTEYGLSGIPVMQVSLWASRGMMEKKRVCIALDLFADWDVDRLKNNLIDRCSQRPDLSFESVLVGLLHKRLIPVVLKECGVADLHMAAGKVCADETARITRLLKHWEFEVTATMPWKDAQVMAGGLDTGEFVPETLESKIVKGIYAVGEVLDVAGDCGGYNLQWAWASGHAAGGSAARGRRDE